MKTFPVYARVALTAALAAAYAPVAAAFTTAPRTADDALGFIRNIITDLEQIVVAQSARAVVESERAVALDDEIDALFDATNDKIEALWDETYAKEAELDEKIEQADEAWRGALNEAQKAKSAAAFLRGAFRVDPVATTEPDALPAPAEA